MTEGPTQGPVSERGLRTLMRLVTTLTVVMIVGLATVVGLMAWRLTKDTALPALPAAISLPDGVRAVAVTAGPGWYLVVTDADEVLVYDATTQALRQRIPLTP